MNVPVKLSAVIITFNEEANILRCIDSLLPVCDEIIVVDSNSTDKTDQLLESRGIKSHKKNWTGYSDAKNFGNNLASGDYILSIDADESLSTALQEQILSVKKSPEHDVYKMNRLTNFCDKWIHHSGWHPDWVLRIFKKGICEWQGTIHENLSFSISPTEAKLKGKLLHYSYPTIQSFLQKVVQYSGLAAESDLKKGKKYNLLWHGVVKPYFKFIDKFFFKLGFLDGKDGFIIAVISAFERFLRYTHFRQLARKKKAT